MPPLGARAMVLGLRTGARFPYALQLRVARPLGAVLYRSLARRRRYAAVNVARCFPDLPAGDREHLVRRHFEALAMGFMETGAAWWGRGGALRPLCRVSGIEHLADAVGRGRGVLLFTGHFTTFEMGMRLLTLHHPLHMLYRANNDPYLEAVITRGRLGHLEAVYPRKDIAGLRAALAANQVVWYAPDQSLGPRNSVYVPFLGEPQAHTVTATSWLARETGAAVVPFFPHRLPGLAGYELVILPALDDFPCGDDRADTARLNAVLGAQVLRSPEQYLWVHRRFKRRPDGANIYAGSPAESVP